MPDLFADIGNSHIKIAAKKGIEWELLFHDKVSHAENFYSWLDKLTLSRVFVTSVNDKISRTLDRRYSEQRLKRVEHHDIPVELMAYETPHTLGMDRFITCFGASGQTSGNVVVIDSGSACTIDIMTADGVFQGGVIMPGLDVLARTISKQLPELPSWQQVLPDKWPGKTSADSLQWGTTGAFIAAITGFLEKYREVYGNYSLFVTGGGSELVTRALKDRYDVKSRPFLVFEGMDLFRKRYLPFTSDKSAAGGG